MSISQQIFVSSMGKSRRASFSQNDHQARSKLCFHVLHPNFPLTHEKCEFRYPEFYFLNWFFLGFSCVEFPLNPLPRWYVNSFDFDEFLTTADPTKKYELFIYFLIDLRNFNKTDIIVIRWWNTDAILLGDKNRRTIKLEKWDGFWILMKLNAIWFRLCVF